MTNDLAYFSGQAFGLFLFLGIIFAFALIAWNFVLGVVLMFFTYVIFLPYQFIKHSLLFVFGTIRRAKRAKYIHKYEK